MSTSSAAGFGVSTSSMTNGSLNSLTIAAFISSVLFPLASDRESACRFGSGNEISGATKRLTIIIAPAGISKATWHWAIVLYYSFLLAQQPLYFFYQWNQGGAMLCWKYIRNVIAVLMILTFSL